MTESDEGSLRRSATGFARLFARRRENDEERRAREEEEAEFLSHHGYPLNLRNPRTFSEKLCWRKLYDRNPLLPVIVDKYAVRGFVARELGERRAAELLVPLLFETTEPETIPFDRLPGDYMIKANHGSGFNLLVRAERAPPRDEILERCRFWLRVRYGVELHEWAYQAMTRRILVEELLSDPRGLPPGEYKFHMFGGECAVIQALHSEGWYDGSTHTDGKMPTLTYFTPEWRWLDVSWLYYFLPYQFSPEPTLPRPAALEEMLEIARRLSRRLDYIRVDLYDTAAGIRIGELTPYHLTGRARITPPEFDLELGRRWRQRHGGWRRRLRTLFGGGGV